MALSQVAFLSAGFVVRRALEVKSGQATPLRTELSDVGFSGRFSAIYYPSLFRHSLS